ncbi:hypothetical protein L9F63_002452, partial [Diploptera punctata]
MRYYVMLYKTGKLYLCKKCISLGCVSKGPKIRLINWNACFSIRYASTKSKNNKDERNGFAAAYKPTIVETNWYDWWEKQGYFQPNPSAAGSVFSMVLPPPNVTGTLHLGHALTCTIQDVLARWHRMRGEPVIWIPGMDHAGIATQVVVEKKLWQEQKLTRHEIGHDKFIQEVWKWKHEKADCIRNQLRKLGLSLDWTREMFTMDQMQSAAVTEAFIRLFDDGLLYRANSLVNWSCVLQSAISDIEVEFKEINGTTAIDVPGYSEPVEFGFFSQYEFCRLDKEIIVSTTRVETMLGDSGVAVHPEDKRYKSLHGGYVWHPFREERIPIICDEFVDPDFGTGAVKITPAHNSVDFEVGKKHGLKTIPIITEQGHLNAMCGKFAGVRRFDARKLIMQELESLGMLRGKRSHSMQIPLCSRSGDVVEQLLKPQWFVDCQKMAEKSMEAVQNGDLTLDPVSFEKTWFIWLNDIRDWCISRQLWWGHQIPAYECHTKSGSSTWIAARDEDDARHRAAVKLGVKSSEISEISRDSDVLDTWFSSALFPFSVMGWPHKTEKFYPLTLMETGHDILFFWVARMVMLGTQLTGQLPFKKILLHGIICDAQGRKMSKSLGNVVFPEDIISGITLQELHQQVQSSFESGLLSSSELKKALEGQKKLFPKGIAECGVDALRFTLCSMNVKNHSNSFDMQQCFANKLFCNKIWQASKYVMMCVDKVPSALNCDLVERRAALSSLDRWILSRGAHMVSEVQRGLHHADFHISTSALRTFIYSEICDFYLETSKLVLKNPEDEAAMLTCRTLLHALETALHALSPFMPFLTEELYHHLPRSSDHHNSESIMVAPFPQTQDWEHWRDTHLENEVHNIINTISAIRHLKTRSGVTKEKPTAHIVTTKTDMYCNYINVIRSLTGCHNVLMLSSGEELRNCSVSEAVGPHTTVHIMNK